MPTGTQGDRLVRGGAEYCTDAVVVSIKMVKNDYNITEQMRLNKTDKTLSSQNGRGGKTYLGLAFLHILSTWVFKMKTLIKKHS